MTLFRAPLATAFALALAAVGAPTIGTARSAPAVAAVGPAVGARIGTHTALLDSNGAQTTLAKVAHGKPIMVILFRSAKWCPYCQGQLKSLGPVAAAARARGVAFIAVSYDKPEELAAFAAKQNLTYPLYSDAGSKLIDALKLRDPRYAPDSFAYGVPYPTTLLLDGHGVVKGKTVETDYKIRPTNDDLIALLARV